MSAVLVGVVLAAVTAVFVIVDVKPWRRPTSVLTVTITADLSAFQRPIAQARICEAPGGKHAESMANAWDNVWGALSAGPGETEAFATVLRLMSKQSRHMPACDHCTTNQVCDRCDGTGTYHADPFGWFVCACGIADDGVTLR